MDYFTPELSSNLHVKELGRHTEAELGRAIKSDRIYLATPVRDQSIKGGIYFTDTLCIKQHNEEMIRYYQTSLSHPNTLPIVQYLQGPMLPALS